MFLDEAHIPEKKIQQYSPQGRSCLDVPDFPCLEPQRLQYQAGFVTIGWQNYRPS